MSNPSLHVDVFNHITTSDISPTSSLSSPRFNNDELLLPNEPMLSGKTIHEVNATKKAVGNLVDYWKVKGLFLSNKTYPHTAEYYESFPIIAQYLDKHTQLKNQPFWNKMLPEDKAELCKYMGLIDAKPLRIMMNLSLGAAELCIVFNGLPTVSETDDGGVSHSREMKQGQLVGPIDLFNDPVRFENRDYPIRSSNIRAEKGGCVLRLPFQAYYKHVYLKRLPPKKIIIPVNFVDEDRLEEHEVANMTEEDHVVFGLRQLGRTIIPKSVFNTMLENDLIGSRANDRGSAYINHLEYGRQIQLSGSELTMSGLGCVFIVLKGSLQLRLSVCQRTATEKTRTILISKIAGTDRLEMKANDLPVIQLEMGSWLTVNKELLTVGQQEIKHPSRPNSSKLASQMSMSLDAGNPATANGSGAQKRDHKSREAGSKRLHLQQALIAAADLERQKMDARKLENAKLAYRLYLKVMQQCTYLAIPYAAFVRVMKDCKSSETIRQFESCLNNGKAAVLDRVEQLLPMVADYQPVGGSTVTAGLGTQSRSWDDGTLSATTTTASAFILGELAPSRPLSPSKAAVAKLEEKFHNHIFKETDHALDDPSNRLGLCGTFMEPSAELEVIGDKANDQIDGPGQREIYDPAERDIDGPVEQECIVD